MTQEKFDFPKLELLKKLMGMTGSQHDGEALSALRKANALLAASGKTWADLFDAKIKVVADPFASIVAATPNRFQATAPTPTSTPYASTHSTPPRRPKPTVPPKPWQQPWVNPNKIGGRCCDCGHWVDPGKGLATKLYDGGKWEVAHSKTGQCPPPPAKPNWSGNSRTARRMNQADIDNLL